MKVRVHELAKKYDMGNKEFLNLLKDDIKITVSSHLSGLAEEDVKKIDKYFENINNNKEEMIVKPEKTTSNGKGDSLNKKVVETETDDIFEEEGLGNGKKSQQIKIGKDKKNWKGAKPASGEKTTDDEKSKKNKKEKRKKN